MPARENYSKSGKRAAHQQRLREEAEERNAAWAALSPQEQLAALDKRGVTAKKQRERIKATHEQN